MKRTVLSLAVLALLGETEAIRLAKQNRVLYADDFAATGEHDLAQEQPAKPDASKTSLHQHQVLDSDDEVETMQEKAATAKEVNAAKKAARQHEAMQAGFQNTGNREVFNRFDGLMHRADGSKFDPVDGRDVHEFLGKSTSFRSAAQSEPRSDEEEIKEAQKEEVAELNAKAEKEVKAKERLTRFNPVDGLIHNADGSREFIEGGVVGGANNFMAKHKHHKHSTEASLDGEEEHHKKHKKHKSHHKKHHGHKKHHHAKHHHQGDNAPAQ